MTLDLGAIRRQVEYYFSDSNLPRDKFLRAKTEENEQGFVDISVLLTFKRLQDLGATAETLIEAIGTSELLALDENRTRLRRTVPLPETPQWRNRAIYAKGWNAKGPEPTIEEVGELFSPSGEILSVRIRRWTDEEGKHFKGSIFVEFSSAEAAERAAAEEYEIDTTDPNSGQEIRKKLLILPVDAYFEKKRLENKERIRRAKQNAAKRKAEAKENGTPLQDANGKPIKEQAGDANGEQGDEQEGGNSKGAKKEQKVREIVPGMVLRFEGVGPDVSREDIKAAFEPLGEVAWVDFRRGEENGHVRFSRVGAAEEAGKAMTEKKAEFGGKTPKFFVISGEAEKEYWKEAWAKQDELIERSKKRRREHFRGGFGSKRRRGPGRPGPK